MFPRGGKLFVFPLKVTIFIKCFCFLSIFDNCCTCIITLKLQIGHSEFLEKWEDLVEGVEKKDIHGGSIRIFISYIKSFKTDKTVNLILKQEKKTIIISSHVPNLLLLTDQVMLLEKGEIKNIGQTQQIIKKINHNANHAKST